MCYDLAGRKTAMTDADMGAWAYAYDALGNLTTQTDANGCETNISYDRLNRLSGKSFGAGCPATGSVTYAWDGVQYLSRTQTAQAAGQKGYRTGMLDGSGYTNWTYDARGRVVNEEKTIGTRSFETDWTYNSADLAASMVYPADENNQREVVSYHYLPQKLLYSLTGDAAYVEASQYDEAGRLTRRALGARDATQAPLAVQYQYAGWGPDANANDDYYDGQGRLMSITSGTENAPGALLDLSYRYDIGGNITQITDANLGPQVQSFGYDALDRIVSAQAVDGSVGEYAESYSYDPETSNLAWVTRDGVASAYQYDANHPHAVDAVTGGQPRGFTYDANGSMTTRMIGTESYTLLYDGALRMVAVQKNSATIAEFGYDGDGQMVSASVGGVTTSYVGGYFEWQTTASGSVAVKYYSAGSAKTAMRKVGVVTYLLGDHLGSTSVAYDDGSTTARRQGYTAFGSERYSLGGELPTRYQYTGQRGFEEIGLQYYGARWYDGFLGRFTQADTLIPEPGNPMAWDRFAYVMNAPLRYTDPSGHAYCSSNVPGAMCVNDNPDPVYYPPPSTITNTTPVPTSTITPSTPSTSQYYWNANPTSTSTPPGVVIGPGPTNTPTTQPQITSQPDGTYIWVDWENLVDWSEVDMIDLSIDLVGIGGQLAGALGGPAGEFVFGASEVAEGAGALKATVDLFGSKPTNAILFVTQNVSPIVVDWLRMEPTRGILFNVISIGTNIGSAINLDSIHISF